MSSLAWKDHGINGEMTIKGDEHRRNHINSTNIFRGGNRQLSL